jgi:hypothetical protein
MAESTPPQDPFEMFRRLWGPLGLPVPGMAVPTLDPKEVEKRIAELRSVESWLQVNLNVVQFAIQGLEVQRSALLAMGAGAPPGASPSNANHAASGMMWPWAVMQQAMAGKPPAAEVPPAAGKAKKPKK